MDVFDDHRNPQTWEKVKVERQANQSILTESASSMSLWSPSSSSSAHDLKTIESSLVDDLQVNYPWDWLSLFSIDWRALGDAKRHQSRSISNKRDCLLTGVRHDILSIVSRRTNERLFDANGCLSSLTHDRWNHSVPVWYSSVHWSGNRRVLVVVHVRWPYLIFPSKIDDLLWLLSVPIWRLPRCEAADDRAGVVRKSVEFLYKRLRYHISLVRSISYNRSIGCRERSDSECVDEVL